MTAAETKDLSDEIAYVRALAEEGRNAPLVGGLSYVVWGTLISLAAFAQFAEAMGVIRLEGALEWAPWVLVFALGWAFSFWLGPRMRRMSGSRTVGNRTANSAWFATGLFSSGFFATLFFAHDRYAELGVPPYFLFGLMFPVALGLYGVAFFASATAARLDWLKWFAGAAWAVGLAMLFLLDSPYQMLVAALGILVCAVAPGLLLMRRQPSDIV